MTSTELEPGYEQVFTVTDYFDGPRQGVANFEGRPHFYDCIFDEAQQEYSDLYRLTPISPDIFELAKEGWAIWRGWELAFHTSRATLQSHPALPQDTARYKEINAVLESALKTDKDNCITRAGSFKAIESPKLPKGVLPSLQVRWTPPTSASP